MKEILNFINSNLENILKKQSGRIDFTTENETKIKIYKCGSQVTRIDIVERQEKNGI